MEFSHKKIEKKWQKYWELNKTYKTLNNKEKDKKYILDMFPYPSGSGLHVGHVKGYTATDIISRMFKLKGYNVLHPIGWDAFGLPAEQYALNTGNNPNNFTIKNINNFRKQLKSLGFSYDYEKEINTSSPDYFKNTQWIFQQLYKKKLAKIKKIDVNWCEELKTVLSNEEVININGKMVSERGNFPVFKKPMKQWVLLITKYANKLLKGLKKLDWPISVKELQKNWIGKTIGTKIKFLVNNNNNNNIFISVFTKRADTIFGVEYLVLAPEHNFVKKIKSKKIKKLINDFKNILKTKTELERKDESKEKIGIFLEEYAINPINNKLIPIWISDYVIPYFGTGAVMGVPGHNKIDYFFSLKYNLPITYVIENKDKNISYNLKDGKHINSEFLNGLNIKDSIKKVEKYLGEKKIACKKVFFKLKDWVFSRQRYWGEPIPVIFWENKKISLVDEKDLPLKLPKVKNIKNSFIGESPLYNEYEWVNVIDNEKNIKGKRETNTMPQWAGSCWYYLAFILMKEKNNLLNINDINSKNILKEWLPVDLYIGGQEHAVSHLLYSRFWHRFLYDIGVVPNKEPFKKLINQGMVLGDDGTKMSKSKNNIVNINDIVNSHGADTLRIYEMFAGPIESSFIWNVKGLDSIRKWLDKVYKLSKINNFININNNDNELNYFYHNMIKKINNMIINYRFNNIISELMIFINKCYIFKNKIYKFYFEGFIKILSCFAPHISEEIWNILGHSNSIYFEKWPIYEKKFLILKNITIIIQINGKIKSKLNISKKIKEKKIIFLAKNDVNIKKILKNYYNNKIKKIIFIKNKVVNFVC